MLNDDYISRNDAIKALYQDYEKLGLIVYRVSCIEKINQIPAADVGTKRKTGYWFDLHASQWVQYGAVQYKCSECGNDVMRKTKYCEECGAKMDAEPPKEERN